MNVQELNMNIICVRIKRIDFDDNALKNVANSILKNKLVNESRISKMLNTGRVEESFAYSKKNVSDKKREYHNALNCSILTHLRLEGVKYALEGHNVNYQGVMLSDKMVFNIFLDDKDVPEFVLSAEAIDIDSVSYIIRHLIPEKEPRKLDKYTYSNSADSSYIVEDAKKLGWVN